jgi:hypothetical protein
VGYNQDWKWKTAIADANRFAAWSCDIAHLQTYMTTPGKLLPWEVDVWLIRMESGQFELLPQPPTHGKHGKILKARMLASEPQPFPPVIIRGPDGFGEPIITPTEVIFNGDESANDACEPFQITFGHLQIPHEGSCKTNQCSYDILVRCALVRLAYYFPVVRVYSDGGKSANAILSRAQRARSRLSWTERLARNARPKTSGQVAIKLFGIPAGFATSLGFATA